MIIRLLDEDIYRKSSWFQQERYSAIFQFKHLGLISIVRIEINNDGLVAISSIC